MLVLRYMLDPRPGSEVKAGVQGGAEMFRQIKDLKRRDIVGKSKKKGERQGRKHLRKEKGRQVCGTWRYI